MWEKEGGREGGRSEGGGGIRVRKIGTWSWCLLMREERRKKKKQQRRRERKKEGSGDGWGKVAINCYKSCNKQQQQQQ